MTEIEELRAEIAKLREEVSALRAGQTVHHYHHQAQPAPFVGSPTSVPHWPRYYPATSGGVAISGGLASQPYNPAITMGLSESGVG